MSYGLLEHLGTLLRVNVLYVSGYSARRQQVVRGRRTLSKEMEGNGLLVVARAQESPAIRI